MVPGSREQQEKCIFCRIARREESNDILFEDKNLVAFRDIHPAASEHILVISKAHIPSLYSLMPNPEDIQLVEDMIAVGTELLSGTPPAERKFGFHYPPFNSYVTAHQLLDRLRKDVKPNAVSM
ncbi:hypothetical protein WJX75_001121 [Coccomyxa subellipsoidea]|uniref:HIT domain-containing protein n=1 Tax=Coccomyxa subellipsoidea TaxID=248742 RepID=A0ABR2Z0C7_9CHLO